MIPYERFQANHASGKLDDISVVAALCRRRK